MKNLERIISFVDNEMTGNDILLLENDLKNDVSLQQTLDLVKELDDTLGDTEFITFMEKLNVVHHNFVAEEPILEKKEITLQKPSTTIRFRIGWNLITIAASLILILCTVAIITLTSQPSSNAIFTQYYTKYEANIITRSEKTDNSSLITAIQLYDKGSYTAAIQKFLYIIQKDENNTAARFFLGVSYMETKNLNKAIENLNFVIQQNDSAFVEHAQWYLALCYVKNGQRNQAITLLNKITTGQNFYKIMALDVLKKLK